MLQRCSFATKFAQRVITFLSCKQIDWSSMTYIDILVKRILLVPFSRVHPMVSFSLEQKKVLSYLKYISKKTYVR